MPQNDSWPNFVGYRLYIIVGIIKNNISFVIAIKKQLQLIN